MAGSDCSASPYLFERRAIVQRAAPERREARAENHARVHMIGTRHDALAQRLLAFVDKRLHKLAAKLFKSGLIRLDIHLLRLAANPLVEAFAALLAELLLRASRSSGLSSGVAGRAPWQRSRPRPGPPHRQARPAPSACRISGRRRRSSLSACPRPRLMASNI